MGFVGMFKHQSDFATKQTCYKNALRNDHPSAAMFFIIIWSVLDLKPAGFYTEIFKCNFLKPLNEFLFNLSAMSLCKLCDFPAFMTISQCTYN